MKLAQLRSRLAMLNQIGQEMSMASNREQLIHRAVVGLRNDLGYEGALIVLRREDAEELLPPSRAVPIRIGGRGIGTIVVPVAHWTSIDQEFLEMFAAHIGVALQNIQFFEKTLSIVSRERLLRITRAGTAPFRQLTITQTDPDCG